MKRVLLVFKRSFLQTQGGDPAALRGVDAATRRRALRGDASNRRVILEVVAALSRLPVTADIVDRGSLAATGRYDLVLTVGGDGTLLATAHFVGRTPVLAINSDPEHSLGLFSGADRRDFVAALEAALAGRLPATPLHRLAVTIQGRPLRERVLNEVLFSRRNPAALARYRVTVEGRHEEQRSSGLWISTAAGSTAAIRAAGGRRMPIGSRRLQLVTREPYRWGLRPYRLARLESDGPVRLQTLTTGSAIWIDGERVCYPLAYGDVVTVKPGAVPLTVLGHDDARRRRLFP